MTERLGPPPPDLEPGLEAQRERWREAKRTTRERRIERDAAHVGGASPDRPAFTMPRMPGTLPTIRKWLRQAHDAYSRRLISSAELTEARRSAGAVADLYRTGAEMRKADAAIRSAEAAERMAEVLAKLDHGGPAVVLLEQFRASIADGQRRPLPGRRPIPLEGEPA